MRDVYILRHADRSIVAITDDFERCNLEMAKYTEGQQAFMDIENYDLLEDGD